MIEAFSTRRTEIEAAVAERGAADTAENQRLAQRAALMTRAAKRDVDRETLRESWEKQAAGLGFDPRALAAQALAKEPRDVDRAAGRDDGAVREACLPVGDAGRPAMGAGRDAGPASGQTTTPAATPEPGGLATEAGIPSETLQLFLARNAGVAEGRMTHKGEREMRAAHRNTALVVDEGSLASTVQVRDLLRIANVLRIPRVVLVGDEMQLDAVDAGKPFAQLQRAGMQTAVMDEIMLQSDPELKAAVEASLAGDINRAFEKLGANVAQVKPDNLAGVAAARWLALSPEERANAGLMAPSHALREGINAIVRERLIRDGAVHGPDMETERLISKGYTKAEMTLAANYSAGDVVAFHRPYKRLGVEKGDELRIKGVDRKARMVTLEGKDGRSFAWEPGRIAARSGEVEVYRAEAMELRAGDRIRWTRDDTGLGLVNSQTAEVAAVRGGTVTFRLEEGRMLDLSAADPQLRHIDRAWASTVHAFQGRTVDTVIAAMEARHPHLTTQKSF